MSVISGNILSMRIDGKQVDCEISSSVNISQEVRPATTPSSGRSKAFIAGATSWTMTLSGLLTDGVDVTDARTVISAIKSGKEVLLDFITNDLSFLLTGMAIPTGVDIVSQSGEDVSYTCNFQGSGDLYEQIIVWSQDGNNAVSVLDTVGGDEEIVRID